MTPCIYELLQPVSQNLPAADLLLAVSQTWQSLAQIAALHPNIWLSHAAKMAPQVYGFYAARPPHCRLQTNVT